MPRVALRNASFFWAKVWVKTKAAILSDSRFLLLTK